jgi:FlaA1/EpsC-like NDP-sugar epimerase
VQTIYHAAAYKHVPLVEQNPTEAIKNNIYGTLTIAQAAIKNDVETFVLISTDKAVRPTNTMGATKRFAELILQALSLKNDHRTRFTMVRFGNVLGSSGSVIPLFREQIARGGPVTVTDARILRYFMTITEAAQLVLQAGAMGQGGDVFVLDMGEPIRIIDLAKRMIHLSGLEIKDDAHPNGEIEISFTGLRPGEKLFEELLIGNNISETAHCRIMRAEEEIIPLYQLNQQLDQLKQAINDGDLNLMRQILTQSISGFIPQCEVSDFLLKAEEKDLSNVSYEKKQPLILVSSQPKSQRFK